MPRDVPKFLCISTLLLFDLLSPLPPYCLQVIDKLSALHSLHIGRSCPTPVDARYQSLFAHRLQSMHGSHLFKNDLHPDSSAHWPKFPHLRPSSYLSHIAKLKTCPATRFTLARLSHHCTPRCARLSHRFRLTARYSTFSDICLIHHHLACSLRMRLNVAGHALGTSLWLLRLSTDGVVDSRVPRTVYRWEQTVSSRRSPSL
jgi:hypothetical protein